MRKLSEEGLVIDENGAYRLSEEYRNEAAEKLKGLNMNHLKSVSDCFRKNGFINRAALKEIFADILSENRFGHLSPKWKMLVLYKKRGLVNIPVI